MDTVYARYTHGRLTSFSHPRILTKTTESRFAPFQKCSGGALSQRSAFVTFGSSSRFGSMSTDRVTAGDLKSSVFGIVISSVFLPSGVSAEVHRFVDQGRIPPLRSLASPKVLLLELGLYP